MKKKLLLILICIFALNISTSSAAKKFNVDSAAIGGITIGAGSEYIKSIYGEPGNIRVHESEQDVKTETWYYGDSFQIDIVEGIVTSLVTSGANGLTTPEGITVGMNKKDMTSKYGKPTQSDKYGNRAIYTYKSDNGVEMLFVVNDGIISEIRIN